MVKRAAIVVFLVNVIIVIYDAAAIFFKNMEQNLYEKVKSFVIKASNIVEEGYKKQTVYLLCFVAVVSFLASLQFFYHQSTFST
jgi:hypothetical protein